MKTIGIFLRHSDIMSAPLADIDLARGYFELIRELESRGVKVVIVRSKATYLGSGRFSKHWVLDRENAELHPLREEGEVQVDLVYDKGRFDAEDVMVLNPKRVRDICSDKSLAYKEFSHLHPKTYIIKNGDEFERVLTDHRNEKLIVQKPFLGSGGYGVSIESPDDILKNNKLEFPFMIQQFIDTSGGIPGITPGLHDLRIILVDGKPLRTSVRAPREGGLLSNVHLGGSLKYLDIAKTPKGAMDIALEIDNHFEGEDRLYSVDMCLDTQDNWILIELNSSPGVSPESDRPSYAKHYREGIAKKLVDMANRP